MHMHCSDTNTHTHSPFSLALETNPDTYLHVHKHINSNILSLFTPRNRHSNLSAEYLRNLQGGGLFWRPGCHETQVTETTNYFPRASVKIAWWVGREMLKYKGNSILCVCIHTHFRYVDECRLSRHWCCVLTSFQLDLINHLDEMFRACIPPFPAFQLALK